MKNVLFPFDGSDPALRALAYLVEQAKERPGMRVHVLNVQPSPENYSRHALSMEVVERIKEGAKDRAAELCNQAVTALEAAGVSCTAHVALGHVLTQSERVIKEQGCDIVVMGTRGMGGLGNLLLGSVATQLVHGVPVPVLLIK